MKLRMLPALCAVLLLLTGCASLLERTYTSVEPHSSKFWESEAAGTLRAENYQDIVNDLLLLIGQHTETATLRLYNYSDDLTVAETLEQARCGDPAGDSHGGLCGRVYHLLQPVSEGIL